MTDRPNTSEVGRAAKWEFDLGDPARHRHLRERGQYLAKFCTCQTSASGQRFWACATNLSEARCPRAAQACGGYCRKCFEERMARPTPAVIDAAHLAHQREWSRETFGPGSRLLGVLDHIRKELQEIEDNPADVSEWVDVIILAFDGAWRAGWEPQQIIDGIKAKQEKNEARTWPDWRSMSADEAIEHVRASDEGVAPRE